MTNRPGRHASEEEIDAAIQEDWNDFWLPLLREGKSEIHGKITDRTGVVIMSSEMLKQIKTELYDIHILSDHINEVYMHFSGCAISKPMTLPREVISIAEERENEDRRDDLMEFINHVKCAMEDDITPDEVIQSLQAWFSIPAPSADLEGVKMPPEVPEDPFTIQEG